MTTTDGPADIERRILAVLDEAGEEYVSALINTVIECEGRHNEVESVVGALTGFLHRSLVRFAVGQDKNCLKLLSLADSEAIHMLNALSEYISWSHEASLWLWTSRQPRLVVLLTDSGEIVSREAVTGNGAERISAFLSARAVDRRWYREFR